MTEEPKPKFKVGETIWFVRGHLYHKRLGDLWKGIIDDRKLVTDKFEYKTCCGGDLKVYAIPESEIFLTKLEALKSLHIIRSTLLMEELREITAVIREEEEK